MDISFTAEQPAVIHSCHCGYVCDSVVTTDHCRKKLPWPQLTVVHGYAAAASEHNHDYLEDNWMGRSCPFSKVTVVDSLLGPVTSLAVDF